MPTPEQLISQKLEKLELTLPNFHRLTLFQLEQQTNIQEHVWSQYLQREDVRQRIHNKVNEDIEIAHRISLNALAIQAGNGNVQAIKELNQLSGILNQNKNRQIVTHYIPRPKQQQEGGKPHDMPQL